MVTHGQAGSIYGSDSRPVAAVRTAISHTNIDAKSKTEVGR